MDTLNPATDTSGECLEYRLTTGDLDVFIVSEEPLESFEVFRRALEAHQKAKGGGDVVLGFVTRLCRREGGVPQDFLLITEDLLRQAGVPAEPLPGSGWR